MHDPPGLLVFFQFNSLLSDTPISLVQAKWPTAYLGAYITANPLTDERQEKGKSNPPTKLERDELLRSAAAGGRAAAARVPGEGRVPAAGVPAGRLPTAGAGVPSPGIPSTAGVPAAAGLPAAVRAAPAAAAAAAPQQRAFLHGGMLGCTLLLLPVGGLLLIKSVRVTKQSRSDTNPGIDVELLFL